MMQESLFVWDYEIPSHSIFMELTIHFLEDIYNYKQKLILKQIRTSKFLQQIS